MVTYKTLYWIVALIIFILYNTQFNSFDRGFFPLNKNTPHKFLDKGVEYNGEYNSTWISRFFMSIIIYIISWIIWFLIF